MENKINEDTFFKILAIGLSDKTPNRRIEYLLKKLYGLDGLGLDNTNQEQYERIKEVAKKLQ